MPLLFTHCCIAKSFKIFRFFSEVEALASFPLFHLSPPPIPSCQLDNHFLCSCFFFALFLFFFLFLLLLEKVLGTAGDSTPSLFFFTDKSRFLFNAGEGTQRLCVQNKFGAFELLILLALIPLCFVFSFSFLFLFFFFPFLSFAMEGFAWAGSRGSSRLRRPGAALAGFPG